MASGRGPGGDDPVGFINVTSTHTPLGTRPRQSKSCADCEFVMWSANRPAHSVEVRPRKRKAAKTRSSLLRLIFNLCQPGDLTSLSVTYASRRCKSQGQLCDGAWRSGINRSLRAGNGVGTPIGRRVSRVLRTTRFCTPHFDEQGGNRTFYVVHPTNLKAFQRNSIDRQGTRSGEQNTHSVGASKRIADTFVSCTFSRRSRVGRVKKLLRKTGGRQVVLDARMREKVKARLPC